jgi:SAM domain (Sterile alpha motif)
MQPIAEWLERLGMPEYAQRFAENHIDLSILPNLADQDLKELGIVLGDRWKILRAVGELRSAPAQPQTAQSLTSSRRIAIMFCDLIISGRRLDTEDWHDLVGAYLDAPSAAVVDIGGRRTVSGTAGRNRKTITGHPSHRDGHLLGAFID